MTTLHRLVRKIKLSKYERPGHTRGTKKTVPPPPVVVIENIRSMLLGLSLIYLIAEVLSLLTFPLHVLLCGHRLNLEMMPTDRSDGTQ
jgi:hypothetical protein